jgi:hypothetical protein
MERREVVKGSVLGIKHLNLQIQVLPTENWELLGEGSCSGRKIRERRPYLNDLRTVFSVQGAIRHTREHRMHRHVNRNGTGYPARRKGTPVVQEHEETDREGKC